MSICQITSLQFIQIDPHSSRLTNVKDSTCNFRQLVHICCKKGRRKESNSNCNDPVPSLSFHYKRKVKKGSETLQTCDLSLSI